MGGKVRGEKREERNNGVERKEEWWREEGEDVATCSSAVRAAAAQAPTSSAQLFPSLLIDRPVVLLPPLRRITSSVACVLSLNLDPRRSSVPGAFQLRTERKKKRKGRWQAFSLNAGNWRGWRFPRTWTKWSYHRWLLLSRQLPANKKHTIRVECKLCLTLLSRTRCSLRL